MNTILITPRSLSRNAHPSFEALTAAGFKVITCTPGETPSKEELKQLLPDCIGWLAGVEPVSPDAIDAAPLLRVISRNGTGVDNLPMAYLKKRGIIVKRAEGANSRGVAELALGLALSGLRLIPSTAQGVREGRWPRNRGHEILNRTVGIIGCGAIGRIFAELSIGIGARVMAYDPLKPPLFRSEPAFSWADIDAIMEKADIVSLHCPAKKDGEPVLGRPELARARPGMIVINTARASLIDEAAMVAAMERGNVAVYATDVFDSEPPKASPLIQHPRPIATSHIGGFTKESVDRAAQDAVNNLLKVLVAPKNRT